MSGIDWMPDEPVPMTATRWPAKSTPSCGQVAVWYVRPAKVSRPGMSGKRQLERFPVAITQKRASKRSPASVITVQRSAASS